MRPETLTLSAALSAALVTFAPQNAFADLTRDRYEVPDRYEVSVVGGYRFAGSFNVEEEDERQEGSVHYDGAPAFGASIGYRTELDGLVYLWYGQQRTEVELTADGAGALTSTRDVTFHYLQFGGILEGSYGPTVPYIGVSVGLTLFDPNDDVGAEIKPSGALEGGFKLPIMKHFHLRLLGRLPVTIMTGQTQIFCIEPRGCSVGLDAKPIVQAELMGGFGASF